MRRLALLPLLLSACAVDTVSGVPSISVGADEQFVIIDLLQQPDHAFDAKLVINGVVAPAPTTSPGHVPAPNTSPFADQAAPSSATFTVPLTSITGTGVHVELDDGGDHYVVDVPQLLAKRALHAAMPQTLHAGDAITLDTGVASDALQSYGEVRIGGLSCFAVWSDASGNTLVMPDYASDWGCGTPPAPGTTIQTTMSFDVSSSAQITTCDGADLTCVPTLLDHMVSNVPVTLAF